jgi:hypothetical protein
MSREFRQRVREWRLSIGLVWGVTLLLGAAATAQSSPDAGGDVTLVFGGKPTTRSKIESRLSPPVREALDHWAPIAETLGLEIVLGERPGHIVIGHAPTPKLIDAAKWMDKGFDLLDPLVPQAEGRPVKATVAVLVDQDGIGAGAWDGLLSILVAEKLLTREGADHLHTSVEGLTLRQVPLFLQPTFDVAGDASAGDDEFRLGNEVVSKGAQCLLTMRTGQQPAALMWGLAYVAEIKLFDSVYHFNRAGFVAVEDHTGWSGEAREALDERRKASSFSLAALAADDSVAGRAEPAQMLTWAGLSYLSQKKPKELRAMWSELAKAQVEADPLGVAPTYRGDPEKTMEILRGTLDGIDPQELSAFLKRGK